MARISPVSAARPRVRSTRSRGTAIASIASISSVQLDAAHQRRLEELEVAMIAAGQLCLERMHGEQGRLRAAADRARVSSNRSGFRFCGMMLEPVARSAGSAKPAEFLGTEEDHVRRQLGHLMRQLGAPVEHRRFQLAARVLHRGDVVVEVRGTRGPAPPPCGRAAGARRSPRRCRAASGRPAARVRRSASMVSSKPSAYAAGPEPGR